MKNNSLPTNPYYILGGLIEKKIDLELVRDFVGKYIQISLKEGKKKNDIIDIVKNFSIELNDALINTCISLQSDIEIDKGIPIDMGRVSVKEAAKIFSISPVTIRNWINDKNNPLPAKNFGRRKTSILIKDLNRYMSDFGKQVKTKA